MILKYISIPELNFTKSWEKGWIKIRSLSNFEKYMTIFWLLGPFIYLIERDPADLWLSSIGLIFLGRCIYKNDWSWLHQLWFRLALCLWLFSLLSALLSPDPIFSIKQGIVWIRFPLYAAAAQVWLAKDKDIRIIMLLSMLIGMLIMCLILIAETLIEPKARLSWPYGDLVPGGYLAKVSLPLFCILMAIAVGKKSILALYFGLIGFLSIGVTFLTGERVNFLIRACSGIISGLFWKPKILIYSLFIIIQILAILILFVARPDLQQRFTSRMIEHIPAFNTSDNNNYWGAWRGGIQQAVEKPLIGIGPSGTRKTCQFLEPKTPSWLPGKNYCGNHPHNFYIQLFAETGFIGFLFGSAMFISIIFTCYRAKKIDPNCPMTCTSFIVPLALFFPLQQFGSFFGQWGNLFIWFAVGFSLSQTQNWRKI